MKPENMTSNQVDFRVLQLTTVSHVRKGVPDSKNILKQKFSSKTFKDYKLLQVILGNVNQPGCISIRFFI